MELEQAITEAVAVKHQMEELKSRYADLQAEIIAKVQIPEGKRTGYAESGNVRARVQVTEKYKWDQEKLNAARAAMGDNAFLKAFTFEWKPVDKKAIDIFLQRYATPEQKTLITNAMTVESRSSLSFAEVTE
jgi:hypothetical protein